MVRRKIDKRCGHGEGGSVNAPKVLKFCTLMRREGRLQGKGRRKRLSGEGGRAEEGCSSRALGAVISTSLALCNRRAFSAAVLFCPGSPADRLHCALRSTHPLLSFFGPRLTPSQPAPPPCFIIPPPCICQHGSVLIRRRDSRRQTQAAHFPASSHPTRCILFRIQGPLRRAFLTPLSTTRSKEAQTLMGRSAKGEEQMESPKT